MRPLHFFINVFLFLTFLATGSFAASIQLKENPDIHSKTISSINSPAGISIIETPQNLNWIKIADRHTAKVGWILKTELIQSISENNQFNSPINFLMGIQKPNLQTDNTNIINQTFCQENHLAECLNILIQKQNQLEIQIRFIIDYLTNYQNGFPNANFNSNYPLVIPQFNFPKILPNQTTVMPIIAPNANLNQPSALQMMKSEKQNQIEPGGNALSITTNK